MEPVPVWDLMTCPFKDNDSSSMGSSSPAPSLTAFPDNQPVAVMVDSASSELETLQAPSAATRSSPHGHGVMPTREEALAHFGTTSVRKASRAIARSCQRDLQDWFSKVYQEPARSNNNVWLRKKLLEAIGGSMRYCEMAVWKKRPKKKPAKAKSSSPPPAAATTDQQQQQQQQQQAAMQPEPQQPVQAVAAQQATAAAWCPPDACTTLPAVPHITCAPQHLPAACPAAGAAPCGAHVPQQPVWWLQQDASLGSGPLTPQQGVEGAAAAQQGGMSSWEDERQSSMDDEMMVIELDLPPLGPANVQAAPLRGGSCCAPHHCAAAPLAQRAERPLQPGGQRPVPLSPPPMWQEQQQPAAAAPAFAPASCMPGGGVGLGGDGMPAGLLRWDSLQWVRQKVEEEDGSCPTSDLYGCWWSRI